MLVSMVQMRVDRANFRMKSISYSSQELTYNQIMVGDVSVMILFRDVRAVLIHLSLQTLGNKPAL